MNDVIPNGRATSGTAHRSASDVGGTLLDGLSNDVEIIHAARMSLLAGLSASISHQVNDSLSAIVLDGETNLALLSREGIEVERIRTVTRRMMSAARRASDNIRRIHALATYGKNERALVDLNDSASEAAMIVQGILKADGISFSTDFSETLPLVSGDPVQLQQVILNLLVNSAQAISDQGGRRRKIELATKHRDGDAVAVIVRDTGRAMSAGESRSPSSWSPAAMTDGARSGLSVCRLIAITHGGSVSEHTLPGGETESILVLPAASDAAAALFSQRGLATIKD